MLTTKTNVHHSKLPKPGATGYLIMARNRFGEVQFHGNRKELFQAVAYPVTDSADPRYSRGIHTAWFKSMRDGHLVRVSGFYFEQAA